MDIDIPSYLYQLQVKKIGIFLKQFKNFKNNLKIEFFIYPAGTIVKV